MNRPTEHAMFIPLDPKRDALLTQIAQEHFFSVDTLETRNSDSLDFHDVGVASLKDALQEAFERGRAAATPVKKARKSTAVERRAAFIKLKPAE